MDPAELFANLDSNQPFLAEDAKKKLHQTLNVTKESWLLNGIFDYYLATNSARCIEILVSVREPHDKYLFDRLCDCIKGPMKLQALTVLGHVLRKQPGWLYKIANHPLLPTTLRLLKTEVDILPLLSALLSLVILLPMIPALMGPHLPDVFEVFGRLAAWNCNAGRLPEDQLVHLQVAMYELFKRLYGMFPCGFIGYLRNHYRQGDNKPVFMHTVRPMLGTVLVHPHLVTASKDHETETQRWKKMGHHDVIVECERFAVDVSERYRDDSCYPAIGGSFRSRSGTDHSMESSPFALPAFKLPAGLGAGPGDKELYNWSPSVFFYQHSNSPPPLPEVSAPTSIPQTPSSISSTFPAEGTSPPEAAIEATPETTPIKDPRVLGPPQQSGVARALSSLGQPRRAHGSQPGSPLRKEGSPFRWEGPAQGQGSAKDWERRGVGSKIARLMEDRHQVSQPRPPLSPLRVISRQDSSSVPSSPVPTGETATWPVARPRPERLGSPGDATQEDQEVLEIVSQGEKMMGKGRSDSVLQEFQISHDEDYDECEQEHGSPCTSGGLHMPNSHSLQAFATRVKRLRYYSQCAPETARPELNDHNGQNIPLPNNIKVRRANSCPEMKKNYPLLPPEPKLALDESDELSIEASSTPVPLSNGLEPAPGVSVSTQTLGLWPMPYEHLFLGVFPLLEGEVRASPAPSPAPREVDKGVRFSPYEMLDKYIEHAAHMPETPDPVRQLVKASSLHHVPSGGPHEQETRALREQLQLLHLQLQYERHRREVHAVRNRRLLGESRSNRALDEHNSALRDQLSLLQREIESLHEQLSLKKADSSMRERELQEVVSYWHGQCLASSEENKQLRERADVLARSLAEQERLAKGIAERCQKTEARLFQVESEMDIALAQARDSQRITADLERMRTELLLAGELNQRYQEKLAHLPLVRHRDDEMALVTAAYHEEIRSLNQQLETRNALCESYRAHVLELESQTREYDEMCSSQKRMLKEVKEEYHEQLLAVESKYNATRAVNALMEERVLELWQRVETLRAQRRPHASPDTSSCHEATAAGLVLVSPHSSPPLSASLPSSEGSVHYMQREIKNLQVIVNQSESDSRTSQHLSSEETTPDGTARSLSSLNHSE